MISVVSSNPGSFTPLLLPSSFFFFFFFAFKIVLLVCCRLLWELLGECVCAREQIRNPFARKKEGTSTTTTTTRGTSSERWKRFICIGEGWSRTRKKTFCFVSFVFLFLYEVGPSTAEETLCLCVCVMTTVGRFGRKSSFSFFWLLFFLLWGWLATAGFHSLSDTT